MQADLNHDSAGVMLGDHSACSRLLIIAKDWESHKLHQFHASLFACSSVLGLVHETHLLVRLSLGGNLGFLVCQLIAQISKVSLTQCATVLQLLLH